MTNETNKLEILIVEDEHIVVEMYRTNGELADYLIEKSKETKEQMKGGK